MRKPLKCFAITCGTFALIACVQPPLPENSRVGKRVGHSNQDLRLPSHQGAKPHAHTRWWEPSTSHYPNPGYYSSDNR